MKKKKPKEPLKKVFRLWVDEIPRTSETFSIIEEIEINLDFKTELQKKRNFHGELPKFFNSYDKARNYAVKFLERMLKDQTIRLEKWKGKLDRVNTKIEYARMRRYENEIKHCEHWIKVCQKKLDKWMPQSVRYIMED